jgi:hypothetical protein
MYVTQITEPSPMSFGGGASSSWLVREKWNPPNLGLTKRAVIMIYYRE